MNDLLHAVGWDGALKQGFGGLRREVVDVDFGGNRLDVGWGKQNRFFV